MCIYVCVLQYPKEAPNICDIPNKPDPNISISNILNQQAGFLCPLWATPCWNSPWVDDLPLWNWGFSDSPLARWQFQENARYGQKFNYLILKISNRWIVKFVILSWTAIIED